MLRMYQMYICYAMRRRNRDGGPAVAGSLAPWGST